MADLKIVQKRVEHLIEYAANSRTHSDQQIDLIIASIKEYGFTNPILINPKGVIIAGHGRLKAAIALGMLTVPTITLTGLTAAQERALVIKDNSLALNEAGAGWNLSLLAKEMGDLKLEGFDMGSFGFADDLLSNLFPTVSEANGDAEKTPDLPQHPVSEIGDVWICGSHRVVCGDSTTAEAWEKALNGVKPALLVTDPPYGVKLNPANRAKGMNDGATRATGVIMNDDRADWRDAWALSGATVAYVWHAFRTAFEVEESLRAAGYETRSQIVWRKGRPVQSPGNINPKTMGYNPQHECAFYAVKKGGRVEWKGDRAQSTVWDIDHIKSDTGHGSQKPVECMARPIRNNSSPGHSIMDCFLGSGTTLVAAHQEGRICHGIELDPAYVDVAVTRWADYAKDVAVLEATRETFAEVMARRQPDKSLKAKVRTPKS